MTDLSISSVDADTFDAFVVYLNDHLSDNGRNGQPYFQPLSQATSCLPADRVAAFKLGLSLPVGGPGWRRLWVARDAALQIVGHVDLRAHAERFAEHRCLLGMGVHRSHRQQGLGQRLIEHAQAWARASALLEWIDLQVLTDNAAAVRLYERIGFQQTGETPDLFRIDGRSLSSTSMARRVGFASLRESEAAAGEAGAGAVRRD